MNRRIAAMNLTAAKVCHQTMTGAILPLKMTPADDSDQRYYGIKSLSYFVICFSANISIGQKKASILVKAPRD
jgi:hypothetical protein